MLTFRGRNVNINQINVVFLIEFQFEMVYIVIFCILCSVTVVEEEDIEISTWTSSPRVSVGSRVEFRCTATTSGHTPLLRHNGVDPILFLEGRGKMGKEEKEGRGLERGAEAQTIGAWSGVLPSVMVQ